MRIPYTVPKNIFKSYKCSEDTILLPSERGRSLQAENPTWDQNVVPDLKTLALRVIVSSWKDNPILEDLPTLEDRDALMETLSTDLPFELVITRIPDDHYWERAAKDRWEYTDASLHGDCWRRLYCERHIAEYLENLKASHFETQKEECDELVRLVKDDVHVIRLRCLVPTKKPPPWSPEDDKDPDEDIVHHIPLDLILPQFPHLTEIYLNFGMIYMDDGFEWRDFQFSMQDCVRLGKALKACYKLRKFSLTRSNLDRRRAAALLQRVVENKNIEEFDFSHCKLGDHGSFAIAEFLSMYKKLKILRLANNKIGPEGLSAIVYGLLKGEETKLEQLDLKLNPFDDTAMTPICSLLLRKSSLEVLSIASCGLTEESGLIMAEVISSGYMKPPKLELDLSNNNLGPTAGKEFENAVKACPFIIGFDSRLCNFSKESESSIKETVLRNKEKMLSKAKTEELYAKSTMLTRLKSLRRRSVDEGEQTDEIENDNELRVIHESPTYNISEVADIGQLLQGHNRRLLTDYLERKVLPGYTSYRKFLNLFRLSDARDTNRSSEDSLE